MDFGMGVTWKKEMENYVNLEFIYEKEKITLLKIETWKERVLRSWNTNVWESSF